jgi:ribonucleotide monophosphatase NagD (HAD superfamily)
VDRAEEQPAAILQGFAPQVGWSALAEAAVALRAGAVWMATNIDRTLPSPRGPLPGNGSLVAALVAATGLEPESVGKPAPALYDAALRDGSRARTLAVGDRLDTDIAGARAAGVESLLVLTGVSSPADLIAAPREQRPNFVGRDLRDLLTPHLPAIFDGQRGGCDAAVADLHGGGVVVHGGSGLDQLRAICALAWSGDPVPRGGREAYQSALEGLDLD